MFHTVLSAHLYQCFREAVDLATAAVLAQVRCSRDYQALLARLEKAHAQDLESLNRTLALQAKALQVLTRNETVRDKTIAVLEQTIKLQAETISELRKQRDILLRQPDEHN